MKKKSFLIFLFFVFLIPITQAVGVCTLDKFSYHPGETATFSCVCSENNERNQVGHIVFMNDSNGVVLQSTLITSGDCRADIFGDSYIFPAGQINYTGNATFSLNANGTEFPTNWDGVLDVTRDDWNVSGIHLTDCIIEDITTQPTITIGDLSAVKFEVKDGITGEGLIHMSCVADGYNIDGVPLVFEPQTSRDEGFRKTAAEGEVGFVHLMIEEFWEPNTDYLFEFHCFSLGTDGDVTHRAFLEDTGTITGVKTCTAQSIFTTNGIDLREEDSLTVLARFGTFFLLFSVGIVFLVFMHHLKDFGNKITYGFFAATIFIIVGAMAMFGFQFITLSNMGTNILLPFNINRSLGLLSFALALYSLWYFLSLIKLGRKEKEGKEEY